MDEQGWSQPRRKRRPPRLVVAVGSEESSPEKARAEFLTAGAAYDPGADRWRSLAPAPIDGRAGHVAVWTGDELIIWGGGNATRVLGDGGAYDPGSDEWRRIRDGPLSPRRGAVGVWTGREVLVVGGSDQAGRVRDAAAYDPEADRWRSLTPPPRPVGGDTGLVRAPHSAGTHRAVTWTGEQLAILAGPEGPGRGASPLAYDPQTDVWSRLAEVPAGHHGPSATLTSAGGRLMTVTHGVTGRPRLHVLEPGSERWRTVQAPANGVLDTSVGPTNDPVSAWADSELYLVYTEDDVEGFVVDVDAEVWWKLPRHSSSSESAAGVSSAAAFWTGDALLVWGGTSRRQAHPPSEPSSLLWSPGSAQ